MVAVAIAVWEPFGSVKELEPALELPLESALESSPQFLWASQVCEENTAVRLRKRCAFLAYHWISAAAFPRGDFQCNVSTHMQPPSSLMILKSRQYTSFLNLVSPISSSVTKQGTCLICRSPTRLSSRSPVLLVTASYTTPRNAR
eukprot:SAG31_NODE_2390_length_5804_cov_2.122699_4_plen_145_part_00